MGLWSNLHLNIDLELHSYFRVQQNYRVTKVTKVTLFSRKYFWKANQLKSKSQIVSHRQPSLSLCHQKYTQRQGDRYNIIRDGQVSQQILLPLRGHRPNNGNSTPLLLHPKTGQPGVRHQQQHHQPQAEQHGPRSFKTSKPLI